MEWIEWKRQFSNIFTGQALEERSGRKSQDVTCANVQNGQQQQKGNLSTKVAEETLWNKYHHSLQIGRE